MAAIEEQRAFSEKLVLHAAVPTFVINPEHKVIIWNRACEELTGMRADEVIGTDDHWKAFYTHKRPCLADIVVNGDFDTLPDLYSLYGRPDLISEGIHAEGWYPNLNGKRRYIAFDAAPVFNGEGVLIGAIETLQDLTEKKQAEAEKEKLVAELRGALAQVKTLTGHLPICAWCKRIRSDRGYWKQIEAYIEEHTEARFTHGICPQCLREVESGESEERCGKG
ncbi:MAG: PAS domain-containing protein [Nitrospirae bacterium]|nr:PAS domain-containing protein [Nitrospirota bacterium]